MSNWKTFDQHPENPDSEVFVTDFETIQVRNWIQAELFSGFAKSKMRWMEIEMPEMPTEREDNADYENGQCIVWDCLGYKDRLAIAEFIFKKITHSPCSFRRLIYSRLGFGKDAYSTLYDAGGMNITNAMTMQDHEVD
jgi:hypothetical protein